MRWVCGFVELYSLHTHTNHKTCVEHCLESEVRSSSPILPSKYHISDYFFLGNKSYMDFTSCVTLGKFLELQTLFFLCKTGKTMAPSSWAFQYSALLLVLTRCSQMPISFPLLCLSQILVRLLSFPTGP